MNAISIFAKSIENFSEQSDFNATVLTNLSNIINEPGGKKLKYLLSMKNWKTQRQEKLLSNYV